MSSDIENLKEQAVNLTACLERLRNNINDFPDVKEARWLETMMMSSLSALENHIRQLEKLEYRSTMVSTLFRK
ncbi:MAG: hypothetical protein KKH41_03130 [Candidatus Thermoplasmatota archaeon]|nr:hypothetical protein [Euryarchaeota archaeon]MBU4032633.1 hypothetical protein [Candidatus Thermoplasmatota archaeon]MBU4072262.1 hypothetical protein [Candidatus Thermoplasmatota archaeon]MBU4144405.1 hypothetical protein [Candidatus Thermoplasmatota archaeon]MBU4591558.1 hypothetical protein [Candidatus Thermoplasmatota archaeon]